MFRWIPYAMVRVTMFFVAGIGVAIQWPGVFSYWVVIVMVAAYVMFSVARIFKVLSGFLGLTSIFLFGYVRTEIHTAKNDSSHVIHQSNLQSSNLQSINHQFYTVLLTRYAEEKANSWKIEGQIESIYSEKRWLSKTGGIVLYFNKSDFIKPFSYGDVILIRGSPQLVKPPSNPGEFDLQRNLFFKNVYHTHYIRAGQAKKVSSDQGNSFIAAAIKVRLWSDKQLKTYVKGEREQATASALVLGVTDGLDNDLLQAYMSTGAMHVLAVSGLHVSIIYWIILLLGKPIEKLKSGKATLAVISVVLLWIYAFVTGWSPSVLRAVMMFTFVALARPWKQSTNIYNTMASSAFCLLVYDPFFLMSVGFQLSYIAVFGIVFIHPHLYRLWEPKSKVWDEVWKVTGVSIAAQIATIPISLFYFHQFPNYFLVANLLVIPASFVVLVVGLAILPFSIVPFAASLVGFVLEWTIYIMNGIVMIIGSLPFSVIKNIYIDGTQALLLAGITLCLLLCFIFKNVRCLGFALCLSIAFSVVDWIHLITVVQKDHMIIYNINGKTTIDFVDRGHVYSYGEFDAFRMSANRVTLGMSGDARPVPTATNNCAVFIKWKGTRITIITASIPVNLETDILIIANNSQKSIPKIKCKKIIIDSSNSFYLADRLLKTPALPGVEVYSVAHSGAFQMSF